MSWRVRGAVVRAAGAPVSIETVVVPDPGVGEAVVTVETCAVCRTDLHYRDGVVGDDFPYLLGHEVAGRVHAVGEGVASVRPGDRVVLNWRGVCGQCRACRAGAPWHCLDARKAGRPMALADGTELTAALGIGGFVEKTLVAAEQCTRIPEEVDAAAAGLLGCGVMTGIGAVLNTAGVRRGESVAVIGTGAVGMAAIQGAALAGATTIVAVGRRDAKLAVARTLGATDTVNARRDDVIEAVRARTHGYGADVTIDAVGTQETFLQAFSARDLAGRAVLVGLPMPGAAVTLPLADVFSRGGTVGSSWYGDCLPERDIPMLLEQHRLGRIDLDAFVSARRGLDEIEAAFAETDRSDVLRTVITLGPRRAEKE